MVARSRHPFVFLPHLLVILGLATLAGGLLAFEGGDSDDAKRPLDLPSGGAGGEDEEDAPEVIRFYGAEYEADAFFWLLDRSGSMQGQAMVTLKSEMVESITQLNARAELGIASFADDATWWQPRPMRATSSNKTSAVQWINGLVAQGWTCMPDGVVLVCDLNNQCRKKRKTIICFGDGVPRCESSGNVLTDETLDAFAQNNLRRTKVNTVFLVSMDPDTEIGVELFQRIARTYGGTFVQVSN